MYGTLEKGMFKHRTYQKKKDNTNIITTITNVSIITAITYGFI